MLPFSSDLSCVRVCVLSCFIFFFQAEDGIRDLVRSRGLGDVYKRQRQQGCVGRVRASPAPKSLARAPRSAAPRLLGVAGGGQSALCLLYTSDAADERSSVDLGGRRIIKKKKTEERSRRWVRKE